MTEDPTRRPEDDTPARQADPPPGAAPEAAPPAPPSSAPPPGAPEAPSAPSPGERWAAPQAPAPGPGGPAPGAGFSSGDPLGGSATPGFARGEPAAAPPPVYPGGYTTPPPPGVGGSPAPAPSAFQGTYVLSGWWRRVGAAVIDGIIVMFVALLIMAPLGIGFFSLEGGDPAGVFALVGALLLGIVVIAAVGLAYAPVLMAMTNGKTVGRMATGIRVVRANGQPMTFGWAALREVAVKVLLINGIAGSFTFGLAGLLDVLWPLWDDEKRALHDFVVDTRTVID